MWSQLRSTRPRPWTPRMQKDQSTIIIARQTNLTARSHILQNDYFIQNMTTGAIKIRTPYYLLPPKKASLSIISSLIELCSGGSIFNSLFFFCLRSCLMLYKNKQHIARAQPTNSYDCNLSQTPKVYPSVSCNT